MNQVIFMSVLRGFACGFVCGLATVTAPAIAQTSPTPPPSNPDDAELLPPTENSSSADLVTQPARSTSATFGGVEDRNPSQMMRELRFEVYNIRLVEGFDPGDPGPANADHVQLLIEE